MTVSRKDDGTMRYAADRANPNSIADLARLIALGSLLEGGMVQTRRAVDMDAAGADAGNLATLDALVLPDGGKAGTILRAYAKTATAGAGEMTVVAPDATPATGQIAVAPNGNIVTLAADAVTNLDVEYVPQRGDVLETSFPVASDAIDLAALAPNVASRVVALLDVNVTEGTSTGRKIVLTPDGTPAAGQAALDEAKTTIAFAAADAATRANVKLLLSAAEPLHEVLEGDPIV